jgi:hypothetical protein
MLLFDPANLPYGRVNQAYTQLITVSDGTAPYTLNHISGILPTGLSFDEETDSFTGTPTTAGIYPDIVIQAVDNAGVTKTHTYSLTILPEDLFTWTPLTPSSGENTQFTAVDGFDNYYWTYASQPGGECDAVVWDSNTRFATIYFYGKGDHKVCLTMHEYSPPEQTIQDNHLVTVINSPPDINNFYAYPYPSFPPIRLFQGSLWKLGYTSTTWMMRPTTPVRLIGVTKAATQAHINFMASASSRPIATAPPVPTHSRRLSQTAKAPQTPPVKPT